MDLSVRHGDSPIFKWDGFGIFFGPRFQIPSFLGIFLPLLHAPLSGPSLERIAAHTGTPTVPWSWLPSSSERSLDGRCCVYLL
jgi:hypothetical protein